MVEPEQAVDDASRMSYLAFADEPIDQRKRVAEPFSRLFI